MKQRLYIINKEITELDNLVSQIPKEYNVSVDHRFKRDTWLFYKDTKQKEEIIDYLKYELGCKIVSPTISNDW